MNRVKPGFLLIAAASIYFSAISPGWAESVKKVYVSTMGIALHTDSKAELPKEPVLFKVQSTQEAKDLVQMLLGSIPEGATKPDKTGWDYVYTILMVRDYKKEACYLLYFPSNENGLDAE